MIAQGRRRFFKSLLSAAAAGAAALAGGRARAEDAPAAAGRVDGVCLYVPGFAESGDFVEAMRRDAPGTWTAHALSGGLTDRYFAARALYERARGRANTFVGAVDPATFAVVHAAIVDADGRFHYVRHEGRSRVTFSAQV